MERTLKKYFDKVYVINYIEGYKRRENIINMFTNYGLIEDIEFIHGMPFYKIDNIAPYFNGIANNMYIGNSNIKAISVTIDHYTAVKTAYELGANSVLIMEDDIIIRDNIDLVFDYLDNLPDDWDFLYFTPVFPINSNIKYIIHDLDLVNKNNNKFIDIKNFKFGYNHLTEYTGFLGFVSSGAYALNRKAMELYIMMFEKSKHMVNCDMIEYIFQNTSQSPLNMYTTKERLFAVNSEINTVYYDNIKNEYSFNSIGTISDSLDTTIKNFKYILPNSEYTYIWKN